MLAAVVSSLESPSGCREFRLVSAMQGFTALTSLKAANCPSLGTLEPLKGLSRLKRLDISSSVSDARFKALCGECWTTSCYKSHENHNKSALSCDIVISIVKHLDADESVWDHLFN